MKKDVIYIDIEDDITAIIGKVKDASAKIVALVPPKRTSVLQSAVNLKLLQKSASSAEKRVVLITNDNSLTALAAGVKIPVAKNLQSRPEIPQIAALQVDDEDVINGAELPVGELAAAAGMDQQEDTSPAPIPKRSAAEDISEQIDLSTLNNDAPAPVAAPAKAASAAPVASSAKAAGGDKKNKSNPIKVPNFNNFRKKLFIAGGLLLLLIPLLVWGLVYAPKANITITAKTTDVNIDRSLTLVPGLAQSNTDQLQFKPHVQELKKSASVEFDATGTKDIGEKAAGAVTVSNSSESDPIVMEAGTQFVTAGGQKFVSAGRATVPGAKVSGGSIKPGVVTVSVQAANIGPEYNVAAQDYTVQGYESVDAQGQQMSGGSRQTVKVVTEDDVTKAREKLAQQDDKAAEAELRKQFTKDYAIVTGSFASAPANPVATPAVGEQADAKAKLTAETTYTMQGLALAEITKVITQATDAALKGKEDQDLYDKGEKNIEFSQFQRFDDGNASVRMLTTAAIGPRIKTDELAKELSGKRAGEIQQAVESISGVEKVTVDLSPFWVNKAPSDTKKIHIKFSVKDDK